jgi:CspA family cold shock protein
VTNRGRIRTYEAGQGAGTIAPEEGGEPLAFSKADLQQDGREPKVGQRYGYETRHVGAGKPTAVNLQQEQDQQETADKQQEGSAAMDLNELLRAHQIEVMKASAAKDDQGRENHFDQVALYADQIRALRKVSRQADQSPPAVSAETIVYGTYAGDSDPTPLPTLDSSDGEGGALGPAGALLPREEL